MENMVLFSSSKHRNTELNLFAVMTPTILNAILVYMVKKMVFRISAVVPKEQITWRRQEKGQSGFDRRRWSYTLEIKQRTLQIRDCSEREGS